MKDNKTVVHKNKNLYEKNTNNNTVKVLSSNQIN